MSTADAVPADGWYRLRLPVRFRDLDPMGHAHHTLPLIYFEEARAAFWRVVRGSAELAAMDYLLAEATVRYHARIRYPGEVTVGVAVRRVGTKSFSLDFTVHDEAGTALASGGAVHVAYDYAASAAVPLPAPLRAALAAWQAAASAHEKNMAMPAETMPMKPPST
jgi:acyl-CoA thioester hydrolase